jgi:large conductance mechanosensitive channel
MRKWWAEFKAIAVGGNVLDLALGFIIGTAFAALLQSFVSHIFLQLIAALIGKRDFNDVVVTLEGTPIKIGNFLTDLLNFILLAVALFFIVKFMHWLGIERGRAFVQQNCPYCFDRVPRGAFVCRSCSQLLVEELPDLAEARRVMAQREARRWPTMPTIPVKPVKPLRPRRKPEEDADPGDSANREG